MLNDTFIFILSEHLA